MGCKSFWDRAVQGQQEPASGFAPSKRKPGETSEQQGAGRGSVFEHAGTVREAPGVPGGFAGGIPGMKMVSPELGVIEDQVKVGDVGVPQVEPLKAGPPREDITDVIRGGWTGVDPAAQAPQPVQQYEGGMWSYPPAVSPASPIG